MRTSTPSLLLVETNSPIDARGNECMDLARVMLHAGCSVQLHLMQDGVTWLQQDPQAIQSFAAEFGASLLVSVDDVSLDLRGIPREVACGDVRVCSVDRLVATMARPDVKTIWHS